MNGFLVKKAHLCSTLNWNNDFNYNPRGDEAPIQIRPLCVAVFISYSNYLAISPLERRKKGRLNRLGEGGKTNKACWLIE